MNISASKSFFSWIYSPEGILGAVNFQMKTVQKMFFVVFSTRLDEFFH